MYPMQYTMKIQETKTRWQYCRTAQAGGLLLGCLNVALLNHFLDCDHWSSQPFVIMIYGICDVLEWYIIVIIGFIVVKNSHIYHDHDVNKWYRWLFLTMIKPSCYAACEATSQLIPVNNVPGRMTLSGGEGLSVNLVAKTVRTNIGYICNGSNSVIF